MQYYLGIDGGGTKTKFLLTGADGIVVSECVLPTCHYLQCGFDGLTKIIRSGMETCLQKAGTAQLQLAAIFAGCAGYGDVKSNEPLIREAVCRATGSVPVTVDNDCKNAWAGALGGAAGVNLVAGTGSVGYGCDDTGRGLRCGGWHHLLGSDEGSGFWFGMELLHEFTKQSDGREEKTALYEMLRRRLALSDDYDLIPRVVEEWKIDRTRIAALSGMATELAVAGDEFAIRLFGRAAEELSAIATAILHQLSFSNPVRCSYSGGIFRSGELLLNPLRQQLRRENMTLVAPLLQPDAGAVLLAMRADGFVPNERILNNLRTAEQL